MRLTMKGKNGSLDRFTQKVKNKSGSVIEYPKVKGIKLTPIIPNTGGGGSVGKRKLTTAGLRAGCTSDPTKLPKSKS